MVNRVILVGNLVRDSEPVVTSGKPMTKMRLATNLRWKDAAGESRESAEFHNVVAFGRLAEVCASYCAKGRRLYIEGRLRTSNYEDRDGNKRYSTEIVADTVTMLQSAASVAGTETEEEKPALAVAS